MRVSEPGPPVTKVGRDDKEGVRVGEVRGEEGAKGLFVRGRDGTDEDRDELDVATECGRGVKRERAKGKEEK